jgi:hypothetical protein
MIGRLSIVCAAATCFGACSPEPSEGEGEPARKLTITIEKGGDGLGTVTSQPEGIECATGCDTQSHEFVIGGNVVLTAEPARDALFASWRCEVEGAGVRTGTDVSIAAGTPDDEEGTQITCTPEFRQLHTLLVVFSAPQGGALGDGSVVGATLNNEGTPRVDCASDGTGDAEAGYFADESETLTATAGVGSEFCGWRLCGTGTAPVTLRMDDNRNCEAVFALGTCP